MTEQDRVLISALGELNAATAAFGTDLFAGELDQEAHIVMALMRSLDGGPGGGGRANLRAARGRVGRGAVRARAGDPRGLLMAKSAIDGVAPLHSVRARERLVPLAAALEARQ